MLDVVFGQASDAGRLRLHNEDSMAAFIPRSRQESRSRGWIFAVADGVGGRDLGEVASATAVRNIIDGFAEASEGASLGSLLMRLVQHANAVIHDQGLSPERRGRHMATTVVCCAFRYDQAVIAHVGDSRCYQVREGRAHLITHDHTVAAEQRELGLVTASKAEQSENRHILTRSLGPELFVKVDISNVWIKPGDVFVLCTDGLHGAIHLEDLAQISSHSGDPNLLAEELVACALEADGGDNASAQVIQVLSTEPIGIYRGRRYALPELREAPTRGKL